MTAKGQETRFFFNRISVEDGLSSQTNNYYILNDADKFVWISSVQGLNRYDGNAVEVIPELANENIHSNFFEDNLGNIWFSTYHSLFRYHKQTGEFTPFLIHDEYDKPINERYRLLYYDKTKSDFWLLAGEQIFTWSPESGIQNQYEIDVSAEALIFKIKNQTTIVLFDFRQSGLIRYLFSPDAISGFDSLTILPDYSVSSYYFENDTTLWVGTASGLVEYNLTSHEIRNQYYYESDEIPVINGIVDPGDTTLILSTPDNGLYLVSKKKDNFIDRIYHYQNEELKPFTHPIDRIYLDKDDNLWVSTNSDGIFFTNLRKGKIKRYLPNTDKGILLDNNIRAITENSANELLCLTKTNIEVVNLKTWQTSSIFRPADLPPNTTPFYIFCDFDDNIWYCSNSGLYVKQASKKFFEKVHAPELNYHLNIIHLFQKSDSIILASSFRSGLFELEKKNNEFVLKRFSELSDTTGGYSLIFEDSRKRLFLCRGQNSILIYQKENDGLILLDTISFSGFINAIIEDKYRDSIWMASDVGLYKINGVEKDSFILEKDNVFPENGVKGILIDSLKNLWISTNRGLWRYHPHSNLDSVILHHYTNYDGLQSLEFTFLAALETKQGYFAFGGTEGVNIFNPYEITDIDIQPNPTITHLEINNNKFPEFEMPEETKNTNLFHLEKLVLKHDQNDLFLRIAALEYSDPSANQYYFQMIGDGDTIVHRADNTFLYPNMQPGTYILTYNASNSDGVWFGEKARQLKIIIKPPWWKTWQAQIFFLISFMLFLFGFYQYRISIVKKEEAYKRQVAEHKQFAAEKEREVAEKEREAAEFQQLAAETETAVLRLQMNPHFIFNSMNSISSYISQKNIETANDYLNRFAKLMRMILKFAAKPFIVVADEIKLLEQYLMTEAMRFEKEFSYTIEHEDDFDPDDYRIPTMILQPFVENAIWHGLSNKKGEGKILIRFWEENNCLHCHIEDNGIGRKAAGESRSSNHESKAMSITEKRLNMLEPVNGVKAGFEIQDLVDEHQNSKGTRVVLWFPID